MKKKIIAALLFFAFALAFLFPVKIAFAASDYRTIRAKISVSVPNISLQLDGEYAISENPGIPVARGLYTVSVSGTNVHLQGNGIDTDIGPSLTFIQYTGNGNNLMTLFNTKYGDINYLGNMNFTVNSEKLVVINQVPLEQYLYGVVAYEMSDSFPLEALKVQAVCARSYAIKSFSPSLAYDIGDTSSDQVYKGFNPNYANVIAAVEATKGQILTYNGNIIATYYAASNGGQTELPGNAWGGGTAKNAAYPYLAQKDDPYDLENPSSLYQTIFVPAQVEGTEYDAITLPGSDVVRIVQCMQSCNVRGGPETNYPIVGTAPANSIYTWISTSGEWHQVDFNGVPAYIHQDYAFKTPNGTYLYTNSVLADIQSSAYNALIAGGQSIGMPMDVKIIKVNSLTNGTEYWPGTGSRRYVTSNANITAKYLTTGTSELSAGNEIDVTIPLMVPTADGYTLSHTYLMSSLRMRGVQPATGGYLVTNGRYGHGVGMSQRGAQVMASVPHNMTYDQILAFYFTGTAISQLDTTPSALPLKKENPVFSAGAYRLVGSTITGLSCDLDAAAFMSGMSAQNGALKLFSPSGQPKASGSVATGDVLFVTYADLTPFQSYSLVIYGDVNADGKITLVDLLRIQKHLLGTSVLNDAYSTAADVSKDGAVTILDLLKTQKHLLGTIQVTQ